MIKNMIKENACSTIRKNNNLDHSIKEDLNIIIIQLINARIQLTVQMEIAVNIVIIKLNSYII
jgi:hypothetical protein